MIIELTNSQNENSKIISQHWRNFNSQLRARKLWQGKDWVKYGLTKKVDGKYFYMTAIESSVAITGFDKCSINASHFIRFQHVGRLERIKFTLSNIYRKVIPSQSIKINSSRELILYERYDYRFNWNDRDSIIEIFVPVDNGI